MSEALPLSPDEEPVDAELVDAPAPSEPPDVAVAPSAGALAVPDEAHPDLREQDAVVLAGLATDDEWADVGDGDLDETAQGGWRIPYLLQNRKLGGGVTLPDGEIVQAFDFVWLARAKSRAWFETDFGQGDSVPQCRSFDGLKADPNSPKLQNGGDCTTCPRASWNDEVNPDPRHPCRDAVEALIFLPDTVSGGILARIRWAGLAVKTARSFWDSFSLRLPKRPAIAFLSRMSFVEEEHAPNGTFLVPHFERVEALSRREANPLIAERDRRLADWQKDIAEDVEAGKSREAGEEDAGRKGDPFSDANIAADAADPACEFEHPHPGHPCGRKLEDGAFAHFEGHEPFEEPVTDDGDPGSPEPEPDDF